MTTNPLQELDIHDFMDDGILKEKSFREKIETHLWETYQNKKVMVKGCGETPIPVWAYMAVTAKLIRAGAQKIMYGEPCSAVPVFVQPYSDK